MQRDLVEQAAQGNQTAFADLATQHVDRCYAIAYRILRDADRAQDVTQQALLSAWRDLATLRDPDRFDAWLYRIVVHACYVEGRSQRRWTARVRSSRSSLLRRPIMRPRSSIATPSSTPSDC